MYIHACMNMYVNVSICMFMDKYMHACVYMCIYNAYRYKDANTQIYNLMYETTFTEGQKKLIKTSSFFYVNFLFLTQCHLIVK